MDARTRNTVLATVGGVLWALVPVLDGPLPSYWSVAPAAPVLLAFGVLECWRRFHAVWGRAGHAGAVLAWVGLGCLVVAAFLRLALAGLFGVFVVAPVAATGFLALWVGSAFLADVLRRGGVLGTVGASAFALALPVSVPANAVFAMFALGLGPSEVGVGLGVYGLAWVVVAVRLYRTTTVTFATPSSASRTPLANRPQSVVAALVAVVVGVLGVASVLPLGPVSGTPFTGQSAILDATHGLLGAVGVFAALSGERYARTYNRVAGAAFLTLAALPLILWSDLSFLPDVVPLSLNLPDVLLHLPVAVLTLGVGFGATPGEESRPEASHADGGVNRLGVKPRGFPWVNQILPRHYRPDSLGRRRGSRSGRPQPPMPAVAPSSLGEGC